jgi:hypothetical protein
LESSIAVLACSCCGSIGNDKIVASDFRKGPLDPGSQSFSANHERFFDLARELIKVGKRKEKVKQLWRQILSFNSRLLKMALDLSNDLLHGVVDVTVGCWPIVLSGFLK